MAAFRVELAIFERFPQLKLGILVLDELDNALGGEGLEPLLQNAQTKLRQNLAGITLSQHPHIEPWREAYRAFGVKAKKIIPRRLKTC
ncbi:MAG: hypothetical protein R2880_05225 [Deinococcales bacterium]